MDMLELMILQDHAVLQEKIKRFKEEQEDERRNERVDTSILETSL